MSTTHIQPLPNVRGRMSYTELGEGKKRTRNIREKTNRIAAQMGDMGTREDFIRFCSAMATTASCIMGARPILKPLR